MASNGAFDEIPECPLCLEPLGLDDINFYPCACRYQICRFCWHRIRTDENGLCPHCREVYPENPAEYTPPTTEQLAKNRSEKKQKEVYKRQKVMESREKLALVRVVQRNLVFVIGLSPRLADPEVLKRNEYFGKYGKIYKVVINNHTIYNGAQGPSVSAYVTYCRNEDASKAIAAVNNAFIDGRSLKASFGTTKYCTSFLKGTLCTKSDCMYLHELGENEASFTKEDMQLGKHQVFENATLASLLPTGSTGKDHTPSVTAEGGVKIKHTVIPRNKEPVQADLAAESALPATAHWASNQKGGGDAVTTDQSNPKPDVSISTKQSKATKPSARSTATEHSSSPQSRHTASSGKRTPKDTHQKQDEVDSLKSLSRPGSVSPSTQKSAHPRSGESSSLTRLSNKESVRTNHSRGSSLTQSLTPNLSPRSTLSDSSSSGSLRHEVEDVGVGVESHSRKVENGGAEGVYGVSSVGSLEEQVCDFGVEKSESLQASVGNEGVQANVSERQGNNIIQQKLVTSSKSDTRPPKEGVAIPVASSGCPLPPVVTTIQGGENIPPMSSPPGLSKTQPLSLSTQSEMVCRQLDLDAKPSPLSREQSVPIEQQQQQVIGRGVEVGGAQQPGGAEGGSEREKSGLVNNASLNRDVFSSLTSAGSGHFGALGINWSLPTQQGVTGHTPFPPTNPHVTAPHSTLHHAPNPSPASQVIPSSSSSQPPHDLNPAHLPGNSFITLPQQQQSSSQNSALPHTPSPSSHSQKQVDDGDELGFDPWDVSQQGLADLLETEAEQKQSRPHPLKGVSNPPTFKKTQNGYRPYMDSHNMSLYKNWQDTPPTSSSPSLGASSTASGSNPATGGGGVIGSASFIPSGGDSLQDEFRALFPNVNISFGGSTLNAAKSKSEKPSPLVQALDASNPSTSSTYLPSQLATALNYSYHAPHQSHAHSKQGMFLSSSESPGNLPNPFLGQSQPGFPASCFRVKGHSSGVTGTTTTPSTSTTTTTSKGTDSVNSYSSCLGPDWPDLGITLGQGAKTQSKLVPTVGAGSSEGPSEAVGSYAMWKSPVKPVVGGNGERNKENKTVVTRSQSVPSSSSAPCTVPPPPPGFSNKTPVDSNTTLSTTTTATTTAAAVGMGNGNQTATTTSGSQSINPLLLANGQFQLLQSWSNLRNLANLTPAQQQQLARANPQLTLQQQQQILAQQYLFQQALMRNPVLQAQSLRMAQQFQLLQQQQALLASRAGGSANSSANSTSLRTNPTSVTVSSATQPTSKLLSSMTVSSSNTITSPSVTGTQSGVTKTAGLGPGAIHNPPKVGPKVARQNSNGGVKGQSHSGSGGGTSGGRSSGQSGSSSRGFSSGHSKSSCQVTGNSGQGLNSKGNGSADKHHHSSRNSKPASAKAKSAHQLTNSSPGKPRQKSSK